MARRYDSTLRQAQAQQTRQAVLDAGRELILRDGYARSSMRAIADRAGIAVDTVYLHFRSKPALLKALLDIAVGGDEDPMPVAERDWVRRIVAEPDTQSVLAAFATAVTSVHGKLAALLIATRAAAEADHNAAELWSARAAERLDGMARFARHLIRSGDIRPDLTLEDTRDRLFTLAAPEVYGLMVLELGRPPDSYRAWLIEILGQQLLP